MLRTDFRTGAADRAVFERYLTRREEKQLLATIARHAGLYAKRDHAWIRLVRYTGLRLGNLEPSSLIARPLRARSPSRINISATWLAKISS